MKKSSAALWMGDVIRSICQSKKRPEEIPKSGKIAVKY